MNTAKIIPQNHVVGEVVSFPNKQNGSNMEQRPKPMVAYNVDLRDFPYMPLDVVRFRDSDFAALIDGESFRAGVILWCAAWHQVPSGSLPNDDRVLANLAGYGRTVSEWEKVKEAALHGWILCSDDRLYHPVICQKANESWAAKQQHRFTRFSDRIRKANKAAETKNLPTVMIPTIEEWIEAGCPKEWKNDTNGIPTVGHKLSNGIPTDFQGNSNGSFNNSNGNVQFSAGIPQNSDLNKSVSVIEDKGLINNTHTQENSNFQNSENEWYPDINHLTVLLKKAVGDRFQLILNMTKFDFHLSVFNAHHENNHLSQNQRMTRFASWIVDKFEKEQSKASRNNSLDQQNTQPGRRDFFNIEGV